MDAGRRRGAALAGYAVLFAALLAYRVWDLTHTCWLYDEQIRDWIIAVKSWREIPLTGTPSTAGGNGLGPIYYWVLWLGRAAFAPILGVWPHVGGITIAVLHTAADLVLARAIARRFGSWPLALAAILLIAAPFDTALSVVIWNPPVAVAFIKIAIGLALTQPSAPRAVRTACTVAAGWFAVQAHGAALFAAGGVFTAVITAPLAHAPRDWRGALQRLRLTIEVILVLQLPWLWHQLHEPDAVMGPQTALQGMTAGLQARPDFGAGVMRLLQIIGDNTLGTLAPEACAAIAAAILVAAAWRCRRDAVVLCVSVLPFVPAVAAFTAWEHHIYSYWVLTLAPPLAVAVAALAASLPPRASRAAGWALLAVMIALTPSRFAEARTLMRLPQYEAVLKGTRTILKQTHELRSLRTTFDMPPETNEQFLFIVNGGRFTETAPFTAVIDATGGVRFDAQ